MQARWLPGRGTAGEIWTRNVFADPDEFRRKCEKTTCSAPQVIQKYEVPSGSQNAGQSPPHQYSGKGAYKRAVTKQIAMTAQRSILQATLAASSLERGKSQEAHLTPWVVEAEEMTMPGRVNEHVAKNGKAVANMLLICLSGP